MESDALVSRLVTIMQTQEPLSALAQLEHAAQGAADPRVLFLLASQYAALGKIDSAEATYTALLQIAPGYAIARFQFGLLQFTSGRPAVAMATWAPLEQLPDGHYLRSFVDGLWHLAHDEFDATRQALLTGIAANGENPPLNTDMQMILSALDQLPQLTAAASDEQDAAAGLNHVLLSGYKQVH